jgi:glycine oxidase
MTKVTILGAGVLGLSVATEIAARGGSVTIIDPNGTPGPHGCSWWAGGMLAPFCEGESAEEPVVRLGQMAANWWQKQGAEVTYNGSLVLALGRDLKELDRFGRKTTSFETINSDQISQLEPDLEGKFRKALYFKDEAHLAPRQAMDALVKNLSDMNIKVQPELGVEPQNQIIDCRGLAAQDRLDDLRGVKGEMLILHCPDLDLKRSIRLLHPRIPLYIVPRGDGIYMLGATMLETSERGRITARSMLEMLTSAYALHPSFGEAEILEIGVDARPAFHDNLPSIRSINGVIYANGLYRHGYLLAPVVATQLADFLFNGKKPEFSPQTFCATHKPIHEVEHEHCD